MEALDHYDDEEDEEPISHTQETRMEVVEDEWNGAKKEGEEGPDELISSHVPLTCMVCKKNPRLLVHISCIRHNWQSSYHYLEFLGSFIHIKIKNINK